MKIKMPGMLCVLIILTLSTNSYAGAYTQERLGSISFGSIMGFAYHDFVCQMRLNTIETLLEIEPNEKGFFEAYGTCHDTGNGRSVATFVARTNFNPGEYKSPVFCAASFNVSKFKRYMGWISNSNMAFFVREIEGSRCSDSDDIPFRIHVYIN